MWVKGPPRDAEAAKLAVPEAATPSVVDVDPPAPEQPIAVPLRVNAAQAVWLLACRDFSLPPLQVRTGDGWIVAEMDSLTSGCLQFTFGRARFMLCYDGTPKGAKGLTQAGATMPRALADKWNERA